MIMFTDKGKCLCGHLLGAEGQQMARAENDLLSFSKERMGALPLVEPFSLGWL